MVFKRGKFYSYRFLFDGRLVQHPTKQGNRDAALKLESAERTRLSLQEAGLASPLKETGVTGRVTVRELLDALESHYKQNGQGNVKNLSLLKRAKANFGRYYADDLTKEHGNAYIAMRQKEEARPATINRVLQIVGRAFTLAGKISPLPRLSEKGNARSGFFTVPQFEAVCSHLPVDLQDFARFAFLTSWRKGEIASLRWNDVDDGIIRLRAECTKTREARSIAIAGDLIPLIERRKKARTIKTDIGVTLAEYVFHRHGKPVQEFRKSWASACKAAGCPGRVFHDLRRSGIRVMVRSGVPEKICMSMSGHRTRAIFDRYNIVSESDLKTAMQLVERFHKSEQKKVAAMK